MKLKMLLAGAVLAVAGVAAQAAQAETVFVDAKSDIFLAGQSSVPTDFPFNPGASGLGAGLLPLSIGVSAGEILDFSASGLASCCLGGSPTSGPDGLGGSSSIPGYGDVAAYNGPQFPLVAVFGGPSLTAPWSIFVVGSSDTGVVVPVGATTLYLGMPDSLGFGSVPGYYNDNTGGFTVDVAGVPEPAAWALMLAGFGGLGAAIRRSRKPATATA